MSIYWSDSCWDCLAGLPHSFEEHSQSVERALAGLRAEREERRLSEITEEGEKPLSDKEVQVISRFAEIMDVNLLSGDWQ